jgi:hypothetical protein
VFSFDVRIVLALPTSFGTPSRTLALLEHTTEYENVLRGLGGNSTAQVVQRAFADLVAELVDEDLAPHVPDGPLREASARYLAGAFGELLRWWGGWGQRRRRAPAVEVDEIFRRLTMPVLRELRRSIPGRLRRARARALPSRAPRDRGGRRQRTIGSRTRERCRPRRPRRANAPPGARARGR